MPTKQSKKKKATKKDTDLRVEIKSEMSYGHVNHDAKVVFERFSDEDLADGSIWIQHCQAMLKIKAKDVERIRTFLNKMKK